MAMELRTYNDIINENIIEFYSNAPEKTIKALEFNGDWNIVKEILLNCGYQIIELSCFN